MGILSWIVLGLIAGAIGKLLTPGDAPGGFIVTLLIGVAGAVIGGFIATELGFGGIDGITVGSLVIAVLGSLVLLIAYRLIRRRS